MFHDARIVEGKSTVAMPEPFVTGKPATVHAESNEVRRVKLQRRKGVERLDVVDLLTTTRATRGALWVSLDVPPTGCRPLRTALRQLLALSLLRDKH